MSAPQTAYYPPYGQSIQRVAVPGESSQEREDYVHQQGQGSASYSNNVAVDHLSPGAGYGGDHHARGPTSGSYQDSAYAPAGSQSRMNSAGGTQSQPYTSRIQPPEYGVPPPPPRPNGASIGEGGYPRAAQVANGNGQPAAYPTYAPQQQSTQHQHHHPFQHHPAKPVPPVEEVGRGWAGFSLQDIRDLSPKAKKRLIWVAILAVLILIILILFEVYKSDFERWVTPLRDWLKEREAWSWVIPLAILLVLSFPPLFGHEVVLLVVGLAFPIGISIGIACAGAILGEALVFLVFKYALSGRVRRKCERDVKWAAVARVSEEAGFKGVMIIRYSIIPPHLANPIFATTGMSFLLYMVSVILSLPKQIIFVVLGDPSSKGKTGAKVGKVIAVAVLVLVTLYGTRWIRKRLLIATREIEAERNADVAAKQRQQGLPVDVNADPYPPPEDLANMSPMERREWEQQMQMDRERQKKPEEQANTYVQSA